MEDKSKKQEKLASQLNNRLLQQLEENIKLIEELESQRDFNNTLIQSTSVFFVAIEANGKLLMMNDPMLKALGYTKKEVLGKDYLTTFVPKNERNKLSKIFEKLSRLHQRTFNENHVLTKDGRLLLVEWHGAPILKGKEFDYFIGLGIDITEQKQAENKIRESQQRMANHLENTPLA
ncbi:MAG: PAS domain S-box protein, partial [Bacteroidetes bacterium]|nr:PAS domain S-box protein [Bacteroidota bacterium]